ncbi:MAG TPA: DUF2510 domain-containing protein [Acidimicrobiia bacterium]|jgi:hypothetical protein
MADEHEVAPAGWYPDPATRYSERFWDGSTWTDQVFDHHFSGQDPEGAPTAAPPRPRERELPEVKAPRRPMPVQRWFLPACIAVVCIGILGAAGYVGLRHFRHHAVAPVAGTGRRARVRRAEESVIPSTLPTTTTTTLPITGTSAADASSAAANSRTVVSTTRVPKDSTCGRTAKRAGTESLLCTTSPKAHAKGSRGR